MKVEIFVPTLFKFKDDEVLFTNSELNLVEDKLDQILNRCNSGCDKFGFPYQLSDKDIKKLEKKLEKKKIEFKNLNVSLYVYHHRAIIKYSVKINKKADNLRMLRKTFNNHSNGVIKKYINDINDKLINSKLLRNDGRILSYYSYILIFLPKNKYQLNNFVKKIETLTFRIIESYKGIFRKRFVHHLRVSSPSTIIYFTKKIGDEVKVELINAVYQHCLYNKKIEDCNQGYYSKSERFNVKKQEELNVLNESQLTFLWNKIVDLLGARSIEMQIYEVTKVNLVIAITALIISIFTVITRFI